LREVDFARTTRIARKTGIPNGVVGRVRERASAQRGIIIQGRR